jgi:hypothetical protein
MNEAIKYINLSIITGERGCIEQDTLYENGFSKVQFPNSKHNSSPSMAVDVVLWNRSKPHIRWQDKNQMSFVAGYIKAIADSKGIKIRCGWDFNNNLITDDDFFDGAHFEIVE